MLLCGHDTVKAVGPCVVVTLVEGRSMLRHIQLFLLNDQEVFTQVGCRSHLEPLSMSNRATDVDPDLAYRIPIS